MSAVGAFLAGRPPSVVIQPITLHECRPSHSSYLSAAGVDDTRADWWMGHANHSVSARYRHQLAGPLVADGERLDDYLTGAASGKVVSISTVAQAVAQ